MVSGMFGAEHKPANSRRWNYADFTPSRRIEIRTACGLSQNITNQPVLAVQMGELKLIAADIRPE